MAKTVLEQWRIKAAEKSGGTSSPEVKEFVLKLISSLKDVEKVLDFGAGRGELLEILLKTHPEWELTGTDILPRPEFLSRDVAWHQQDLNIPWVPEKLFDLAICSEVIEHLENPRQLMRDLATLVRPGGWLILTMPNQESYRSLLSLWLRGNHVSFIGDCYPAHITALLAEDLKRISAETGFENPQIHFSGSGVLPKLTSISWQQVSFGLFRSKRFSDGVGMLARRTKN